MNTKDDKINITLTRPEYMWQKDSHDAMVRIKKDAFIKGSILTADAKEKISGFYIWNNGLSPEQHGFWEPEKSGIEICWIQVFDGEVQGWINEAAISKQ